MGTKYVGKAPKYQTKTKTRCKMPLATWQTASAIFLSPSSPITREHYKEHLMLFSPDLMFHLLFNFFVLNLTVQPVLQYAETVSLPSIFYMT